MSRNLLTLALLAGAAAPLPPAEAQTRLWTRQVGTPASDESHAVVVDSAGNSYITGYTLGNLGGPTAGDYDVYLAKYDASGALLWLRQLGTSAVEVGEGLAVDSAGNVYIAGYSEGNLGGPSAGGHDVFLAKYDPSGAPLWMRQFGSSAADYGRAVAVDSAGNPYVTGYTEGGLGGPNAGYNDVFLAKYDASGTLLWTRQTGTSVDDWAYGVGVDGAGNAYIGGTTDGSLGGPNAGHNDAFLAKCDASGTLLWARQTGTSAGDQGYGVAVDGAGNAYIGGTTDGSLGGPSAGGTDFFVTKYDASGAVLWTGQAGTSRDDRGYGVAVDGAGNSYIAGHTYGSLAGPNAGYSDAFLGKFSASGALVWSAQIGPSEPDLGVGAAVDSAGNAYLTGYSWGGFGEPNLGSSDVFLAKYGPAPCYPNCDGSTAAPLLNVLDFTCFLNKFAAADPYANCDNSTTPPILNVLDFTCFLNKFAAGCP